MSEILSNMDNLIADLNIEILKTSRQDDPSLYKQQETVQPHKYKANSPARIKIPRDFNNTTTITTPTTPDLIAPYSPPADNSLASIASLPDAFGGWIEKASYNLLKKRVLKKKNVIVANATLYIFTSDKPTALCDERYPISPNSFVRVLEKGIYAIEFYTENTFQRFPAIPVPAPPSVMESVVTKTRIEFQLSDSDEMKVWLECCREAIEEVKNGRIPLECDENGRAPRGSISEYSVFEEYSPQPISSAHTSYISSYSATSSGSERNTLLPSTSGGNRKSENNLFAQSQELQRKTIHDEKKRIKNQDLVNKLEFFLEH